LLDDPEIAGPASLHDDRSSWRLRPNPIGSNTSCRCRSRRPRWEHRDRSRRDRSRGPSGIERASRLRRTNPPKLAPGKRTLARTPLPGRAASRTSSRKEMRSAAPEVPSIAGLPFAGSVPLHSLSPTCGWRTRASSISAPDRRTDGASGATVTRPSPDDCPAFARPRFPEGSTRRAR